MYREMVKHLVSSSVFATWTVEAMGMLDAFAVVLVCIEEEGLEISEMGDMLSNSFIVAEKFIGPVASSALDLRESAYSSMSKML